jgi:hypothetical protein
VLTALLERPAERDLVAAVDLVDLVGLDAEALAGVTPRPRGREHAVVAAEEIARRHVRPRLEGPRLAERLRGLLAFSPPGLRTLAKVAENGSATDALAWRSGYWLPSLAAAAFQALSKRERRAAASRRFSGAC